MMDLAVLWAKEHGYPREEGEFGLVVLGPELDGGVAAAARHPEGKADGACAREQDEPTEIGEHETLNGRERDPGSGGINDGKGDDAEIDDGDGPEEMSVVVAEKTGFFGLGSVFHDLILTDGGGYGWPRTRWPGS